MNAFAQFSASLTEALDGLVRSVAPSLAVVSSRHEGAGAGIVWSREGLILTNAHVVPHRSAVVRLHDGREFDARLVGRDPEVDLALLEIEARDLPAMRVSNGMPRVGEMVFAFGHPWGQRDSVSSGVVSALGSVQTRGRRGSLRVVRSDVPLAPGNSGGPLVNGAGELVGINAMIVGGDQSISIAAGVAGEFVAQALSGREVSAPRTAPVPEEVF
jgi:serine protease Do